MFDNNGNATTAAINEQKTQYIAYYVAPKNKLAVIRHKTRNNAPPMQPSLAEQQSIIEEALAEKPATLSASFTDTLENSRTQKWPELMKAIQICRTEPATLVIAEVATLTTHESLTHLLLGSNIPFYCVDQPLIDRKALEALTHYIRLERKKHGQRIRAGLALTTRASGNPDATTLIGRVNKPRIYTAILFAQLLMPLIKTYLAKGCSQRQIVKKLNEEGFSAPEGGKWVLSQLQKVLERAKLNELALETQPILDELLRKNLSSNEIADAFNTRNIPVFKRPNWKGSHIEKLIERIHQINEIKQLNRFILDFLPLLHAYQKQNYSAVKILELLQAEGLPVQANKALPHVEYAHQKALEKEQLC